MTERKASYKLWIAVGTPIVLCVIAVFGFFFLSVKERERHAPERILTYSDIPSDAEMKATLSMGGKLQSLIKEDDGLSLTTEQRENFRLPYTLDVSIQRENGYRDLSWKIDARGVEYLILADGFQPTDKITLSIDDRFVYTIPFDWSGRIELPVMAMINKDTKSCINIVEADETLAFCHFLTGKKAS